jgi:hypothetical protein
MFRLRRQNALIYYVVFLGAIAAVLWWLYHTLKDAGYPLP